MVAVARALSGDVRVLLLDEPFEGLAPAVVEQLFESFDRLRHEVAIVIVDHHLDLALALSDRTVALERGRVIHSGPSKDLRDDLDLAPQGAVAVTLGRPSSRENGERPISGPPVRAPSSASGPDRPRPGHRVRPRPAGRCALTDRERRGARGRAAAHPRGARRACRGTASSTIRRRAAARVAVAPSLADAVAGVDLVQENGPERVEDKRAIFAELDRLAPREAILASSTSAIVASRFTEDLPGRARCLVAHPVNPPHLVPVVELCGAPWTSPRRDRAGATRSTRASARCRSR